MIDSLHNPDLGTMWPLLRWRRNGIFKELPCWCWENVAPYGWVGVSATGEVWWMPNADTHAQYGERRPKCTEDFFMFKNISCLAIKYESLFHINPEIFSSFFSNSKDLSSGHWWVRAPLEYSNSNSIWNLARPYGAPGIEAFLCPLLLVCRGQTPASMIFPEFQRAEWNSC